MLSDNFEIGPSSGLDGQSNSAKKLQLINRRSSSKDDFRDGFNLKPITGFNSQVRSSENLNLSEAFRDKTEPQREKGRSPGI